MRTSRRPQHYKKRQGSSPHTGSLRFLARVNTHKQPENIQFPYVEMSTQFLGYGGHTSDEAWVLTLQYR